MELTMDIAIGFAICGMMGWMMSSGKRYRSNPAQGLIRGLLFGLGMLVPFLALVPLLATETPVWMANLWLGATVLYQGSLGALFIRHRASTASTRTPAKESLKVSYGSIGLNDITPAA